MGEPLNITDAFDEIMQGVEMPALAAATSGSTLTETDPATGLVEPFGVSVLKEIGTLTMTDTAVIRSSYATCCGHESILGGRIHQDTSKDDPKDDE